jgi:hypothetical protein
VLLAGLPTGHKVGLLVVAGCFIAFALVSSLVVPRKRPDFPGRTGLSVYIIVCFAFFTAQILAVIYFGAD